MLQFYKLLFYTHYYICSIYQRRAVPGARSQALPFHSTAGYKRTHQRKQQ